MPALRLGLVEPKDAVAAFADKGLLLPSFRWDDVWQEEHARGVAVAVVMKYEVLQLFADELAAVHTQGRDLRAFAKSIQPKLAAAGYWGKVEITDPRTGELRTTEFNKARLQLIFDTNVRQANAAGRWAAAVRNQARKPFLMYLTRDDDTVRAAHRPWHGVTLPVENAFWKTHFPPCGWRCRCRAIAVDEKDIARWALAGIPIKREAPPIELVEYTNKGTGETVYVPRGIDPGFAYNPGMARPYGGVSPHEIGPGVLSLGAVGTPATWRLPVPKSVSANTLMPKGLTERAYVDAFLAEFDHKPEFTDVTGEKLLISDELFRDIKGDLKIMKRGREQFVRLLAQAIQDPDEIWMAYEHHFARDVDVVRRRYVARFQIEGQDKPVLAVFENGKDGWRSVSGYQAQTERDAATVINEGRRGEIVYRRKQ